MILKCFVIIALFVVYALPANAQNHPPPKKGVYIGSMRTVATVFVVHDVVIIGMSNEDALSAAIEHVKLPELAPQSDWSHVRTVDNWALIVAFLTHYDLDLRITDDDQMRDLKISTMTKKLASDAPKKEVK